MSKLSSVLGRESLVEVEKLGPGVGRGDALGDGSGSRGGHDEMIGGGVAGKPGELSAGGQSEELVKVMYVVRVTRRGSKANVSRLKRIDIS